MSFNFTWILTDMIKSDIDYIIIYYNDKKIYDSTLRQYIKQKAGTNYSDNQFWCLGPFHNKFIVTIVSYFGDAA